ncbi:hypothetical protein [Mesorhizobium sp. STM 4661]|nr:hypothetical protein [Mesorhizobium sp. STM 4661]
MSSLNGLVAAARQPESHELYRRMVALEIASSFACEDRAERAARTLRG